MTQRFKATVPSDVLVDALSMAETMLPAAAGIGSNIGIAPSPEALRAANDGIKMAREQVESGDLVGVTVTLRYSDGGSQDFYLDVGPDRGDSC